VIATRRFAALALGLLLPLGAHPASAEPPVSCAGGLGRAVAPARVRRDAAGGAFFEYVMDGATITSAEAPPGLDLTTAPAETLERYGLPPRPDGEGLAEWTAAMRAYRSTANDPDHALCVGNGTGRTRRSASETQCSEAPQNCTNWAGRSARLGGYTGVAANVTVPSMPLSGNCASEGHTSTWVGIGTEAGASGVLQAGTVSRLFPGVAINTYAFYEWVNSYGAGTSPILSAWNAAPGHQMYERVSVNTSSRGVNFYVEDVTTGQHLTSTVGGIYGYYDGDSAGWIVENHTLVEESNIKTSPWNWTNALVTRYSTTTYGGSTQNTEVLVGVEKGSWPANDNEIIEAPGAWSSTTAFPTSWYACRGT
jgi:hypothetical protein